MLSWEGLAQCCLSVCAFICCNKYRGACGCCGAGPTSGSSLCLHGNSGGTAGDCGDDGVHSGVERLGLLGLVGGWASLTKSSPNLL